MSALKPVVVERMARVTAVLYMAKAEESEKRLCPYYRAELMLRQFQSGPKEAEFFHGCLACRKGWPVKGQLEAVSQ